MQFLLRIIILRRTSTSTVAAVAELASIAKPNCRTQCGDVRIPYPFGIGPSNNCHLDKWFECNNSTSPHKPFLENGKLELLNISVEGALRVNKPIAFFQERNEIRPVAKNWREAHCFISQRCNRFTAVSCGFFVLVKSDERVVGVR